MGDRGTGRVGEWESGELASRGAEELRREPPKFLATHSSTQPLSSLSPTRPFSPSLFPLTRFQYSKSQTRIRGSSDRSRTFQSSQH